MGKNINFFFLTRVRSASVLSEITASAIKNTKDINNKPPAAHQKTLKLLRNIETGDPLRFIRQGLKKKRGSAVHFSISLCQNRLESLHCGYVYTETYLFYSKLGLPHPVGNIFIFFLKCIPSFPQTAPVKTSPDFLIPSRMRGSH